MVRAEHGARARGSGTRPDCRVVFGVGNGKVPLGIRFLAVLGWELGLAAGRTSWGVTVLNALIGIEEGRQPRTAAL